MAKVQTRRKPAAAPPQSVTVTSYGPNTILAHTTRHAVYQLGDGNIWSYDADEMLHRPCTADQAQQLTNRLSLTPGGGQFGSYAELYLTMSKHPQV